MEELQEKKLLDGDEANKVTITSGFENTLKETKWKSDKHQLSKTETLSSIQSNGNSSVAAVSSEADTNKSNNHVNNIGSKSNNTKKKKKHKRNKPKAPRMQILPLGDSDTDSSEAEKKQKQMLSTTKVDVKKQISSFTKDDVAKNWKLMAKEMNIRTVKRKRPNDENLTKDMKKKKRKVWFDDVDEYLLDEDREAPKDGDDMNDVLVKKGSDLGLTKCLAIDCEMVGVGFNGRESILARVSIVNLFGHCVYDTFVKPREKVTAYRTWVSGVRASDLETGEDFEVVQKKVADIVKGRILVGHAIDHDLKVLLLDHPKKLIRDTQKNKYYRSLYGGKLPGLRKLAKQVLKVDVQAGEHSSVVDAQATMRLYTMVRAKWEKQIKEDRLLSKLRKSGETGISMKKKNIISNSTKTKTKRGGKLASGKKRSGGKSKGRRI